MYTNNSTQNTQDFSNANSTYYTPTYTNYVFTNFETSSPNTYSPVPNTSPAALLATPATNAPYAAYMTPTSSNSPATVANAAAPLDYVTPLQYTNLIAYSSPYQVQIQFPTAPHSPLQATTYVIDPNTTNNSLNNTSINSNTNNTTNSYNNNNNNNSNNTNNSINYDLNNSYNNNNNKENQKPRGNRNGNKKYSKFNKNTSKTINYHYNSPQQQQQQQAKVQPFEYYDASKEQMQIQMQSQCSDVQQQQQQQQQQHVYYAEYIENHPTQQQTPQPSQPQQPQQQQNIIYYEPTVSNDGYIPTILTTTMPCNDITNYSASPIPLTIPQTPQYYGMSSNDYYGQSMDNSVDYLELNTDSDEDEKLTCKICRGKKKCFCYFIKVGYHKFPSYVDFAEYNFRQWKSNLLKSRRM